MQWATIGMHRECNGTVGLPARGDRLIDNWVLSMEKLRSTIGIMGNGEGLSSQYEPLSLHYLVTNTGDSVKWRDDGWYFELRRRLHGASYQDNWSSSSHSIVSNELVMFLQYSYALSRFGWRSSKNEVVRLGSPWHHQILGSETRFIFIFCC